MVAMDTSYLEKQVSTIINKLHELFDEIGVPSHDRDSRESELFAALSETLHNQLRLVTNEKHELAEKAENLITTIKQMQVSLDGKNAKQSFDHDLKVSYPLKPCLKLLSEKHAAVSKVHRERYEHVKKLALAIESYSSHLEPSFAKVQLPPLDDNASIAPTFDLSHAYFSALDDEFSRVYEEYQRRLNTVQTLAAEIITLWAELGTPQAQTDSKIIECSRDAPEQLGLHADDLSRLKARRDKLVEEKRAREKRLRDIGTQIEQLWERLCIPEAEQREFLARNRGCGMRVINEFEDELGRLNELKKQNLGLFVEEARLRLQALWDGLYFSEEEMLQFTPAFSDVYSDALLAAHESEIARLEALQEQRAPILALIDRHKSLIKERDDLTASSQDASRLMLRGQKGEKRDPTRLLREEKMRKRIAKELPKIEKDLQKLLETWEDEYGRPFLVCGEQYLEEIASAQARGPPPPRSKTPSGHPPPSRSNSKGSTAAAKAATVRGAPQPAAANLRSKTPTNFATIRGNPLSQSTMQRSAQPAARAPTSPSRIPAPRAPLASTHGNNSPERRYKTLAAGAGAKSMGPPRLPPPKMKDLFAGPPGTPHAGQAGQQAYEDRSASIVRQVPPDDPYVVDGAGGSRSRAGYYPQQQHQQHQHQQPPSAHPSLSASVSAHHHYQQAPPPDARYNYSHAPAPPPGRGASDMRHTSGTSAASSSNASTTTSSSLRSRGAPESVTTAASGSENWETYDEDDDDGFAAADHPRSRQESRQDVRAQHDAVDATEAYYARLRAQHGNKRASPDGGGGGGWEKRVRGNNHAGPLAASTREEWMEDEARY